MLPTNPVVYPFPYLAATRFGKLHINLIVPTPNHAEVTIQGLSYYHLVLVDAYLDYNSVVHIHNDSTNSRGVRTVSRKRQYESDFSL
jgi:hypothetical protein